MAGIYIHIPFCKQACLYCNFHFSTSLRLRNEFIDALLKEIALTDVFTRDPDIESIYFGGGTPSLLLPEELAMIFEALSKKFTMPAQGEITLEANPDDISIAKLAAWRNLGINRLSIGVQSFFDEDLRWMNRAHDAQQSLDSIRYAQDKGFENITIDLIYGLPELSDTRWAKNVEQVVDLHIPHISCYALTVEPRTALYSLIRKKKLRDTDAGQQVRQSTYLMNRLGAAGYEHYEISNFALPGKRSIHNSAYWLGKAYYGFGPSAHSFNGTDTRSWNIANNALYIQSLRDGTIPSEKEILTTTQRLNEYIMTALRRIEGIDLEYIGKTYGEEFVEHLLQSSQPFLQDKLLLENNRLSLTQLGKHFADGIASDLFQTEA